MTSTAMIIAEELELPVSKVKVTLADARPELLFNQLTGGSSTTTSTYTTIRVAAAVAKGALLEAAAILLGAQVSELIAKGGVIQAPGGGSATYGQLAKAAALICAHAAARAGLPAFMRLVPADATRRHERRRWPTREESAVAAVLLGFFLVGHRHQRCPRPW